MSTQTRSSRPKLVAALVTGIGAAGAAVPASSIYDLVPVVLGLAVIWFVYPLVAAARRGDGELVESLLAARRESLTILILMFLGRLAVGLVAIVVGLYFIPLAALVYVGVTPSVDSESATGFLLGCALIGGGAAAWVTAPFCAGLCDGVDGSGSSTRMARALRRLAMGPRWAGRCVIARLSPVVDRPFRVLFAWSVAWVTALIVVAVYAAQGAFALGGAFEGFGHYGLDTGHVAVGAAVGLVVLAAVLDKLRGRVGSVEGACTFLFLEFIALVSLWAGVGLQLTEHAGVWEVGPGAVTGALFGAGFAILLDLCGAAAAGMLGITKRRREQPQYLKPGGLSEAAFTAGRRLGEHLAAGGTVRALLSSAFEAPTARRSSAEDLIELWDILRALRRDWTGRLYLACIAAIPVTFVITIVGIEPRGMMLVTWLVLAGMSLWGLFVLSVVLAAIGRDRADAA